MATLLDLFLLDCEGRPRNNLKPSMATPWNDGLLASLLLMLDHPACEQWLRRHQVPIDSSGAHQWAGNAMRRMDLVDPMADPAFVCLDKDTGTTLQGAAIAIALFRGEDDNAIRKIAGRHPLTTKEIAICMARTLYRWEVDNALKTRCKTPSLEGLIWLHQQCPGSTIVQGAEAIFMNDENIQNIIVPFVNSLKKVEAELLQQRLDNRTATVPQHQHRNPRL